MAGTKRLRIMIAKPGLDGHDRGAQVLSRALRDAGMEVIYTGRHRSPAEIVKVAVEEDVDVVGLSILSGAHLTLTRQVLELLRQTGADDVPVLVGGTISKLEDQRALLNMGVRAVFPVGSDLKEIITYLQTIEPAADRP